MTAGTVCVPVAAGKPTTNWLTWRCRADCSKTVLLRPETLDRRPPMVDSLNGGIRKRFDPAERSAGRPDTSATWTNELRQPRQSFTGVDWSFCTMRVHRVKWRHRELWSLCCGATRYLKRIESVGLWKCPYYHYLAKPAMINAYPFALCHYTQRITGIAECAVFIHQSKMKSRYWYCSQALEAN